MTLRRIAIMGGSFNPVHIGHLMVADYVRQVGSFDELWMMLTPLNPLKSERTDLVDDRCRMDMLRLACRDMSGIIPSDFELSMPRPSYTIDTLRTLSALHPDCRFSIVIGSDNWLLFPRWREADEIIREFGVTVYPRPGYVIDNSSLPQGVTTIDAPTVNLSSTWLRQNIAQGFDVNIFLPRGVYKYICDNQLYTQHNVSP